MDNNYPVYYTLIIGYTISICYGDIFYYLDLIHKFNNSNRL